MELSVTTVLALLAVVLVTMEVRSALVLLQPLGLRIGAASRLLLLLLVLLLMPRKFLLYLAVPLLEVDLVAVATALALVSIHPDRTSLL